MVLGTHKANSQSLVLLLSARPPHWHWSFKLAALTWDRVNPVLVRMWEGRGRRYLAVTMWLLQFSKWDFYYSLRVTASASSRWQWEVPLKGPGGFVGGTMAETRAAQCARSIRHP